MRLEAMASLNQRFFLRFCTQRNWLAEPRHRLLKTAPLLDETHMKKCTRIDLCSLNFDGSCKNLEFSFSMNDDEKSIDMLPSKWGLICFVCENRYYACNPSTQMTLKLPEARCFTSGDAGAGFGYLKEKDEYVLVHLFDRNLDIDGDDELGCEVLRLRDGEDLQWKVVEANCPFLVQDWGVLVQNVFYWMIWDEYQLWEDDAIVSFDLEKEEFGNLSPPKGCFDSRFAWFLVELGRRLCLVDNASHPLHIDIWVLKDFDNHAWVREYSIDVSGYGYDLHKSINLLDYRNGYILMDVKQESLDCYDVEKKSIRRMDHLIAGEWNWLRIYTESFFSLGSS